MSAPRIHWGTWCLCIFSVIALVIGFGVLVAIDFYERGRVFQRELDAMTPKAAIPAPANALTQWSCSKEEFREHLNACKTRLRMGAVK